ncbi:hypothetical protein [Nitrosococcus wardiae]|nr:hypothetical protein [Nitrosococcus wardiae]
MGKVINLGEPTETNGMDQDISIMPLDTAKESPQEVIFPVEYICGFA